MIFLQRDFFLYFYLTIVTTQTKGINTGTYFYLSNLKIQTRSSANLSSPFECSPTTKLSQAAGYTGHTRSRPHLIERALEVLCHWYCPCFVQLLVGSAECWPYRLTHHNSEPSLACTPLSEMDQTVPQCQVWPEMTYLA